MRAAVIPLLAALTACGSSAGSAPVDSRVADAPALTDAAAPAGVPGTVGLYEAEAMMLAGRATIVGTADGSDRTLGDLGGEASGRQAVTLTGAGDAIALTVLPADAGANAIVVRASVPDAPGGGGQLAQLMMNVTGTSTWSATLQPSSRYAWAYGGVAAGTKLYNVPANAQTYAGSTAATHLYDETQLLLPHGLAAGAVVTFTVPAGSPPVTLDFVELEVVAPPLAAPAGFLAITDPSCGAIAADTHGTGRAFDGVDDASYASAFTPVLGTNPFNPTSGSGVQPAGTQEKDTYASAPGDALQDAAPTAASGGLGMLALADHNAQSLATCIGLVTAPGSGYAGVWIPPGRFYARGVVTLPSGLVLQGAGMWYAKLVAVDTAPPAAATNGTTGAMGIASVSGDLRLASATGGSSHVALADFALFGNVTQRDVVDRVIPIGVIGAFTASTFARLWIEHYNQAIVMNGSSAGDTLDGLRARDTFADGIDFYGETSTSVMERSQARSTGDDGFAIWSQGTTSVSTGNSLMHCESRLQWIGNGFAVYGGTDATLADDAAADVLNGAGLKLATEFVAPTLPASFAMSGIAASGVTLARCGGNPTSRFGAVLVGAEVEDIAGITLDGVVVTAPTYAAFDVRLLTSIGAVAMPGSVAQLAITNAEVIGAPTCAEVAANEHGDAELGTMCACAAVGAAALPCGVTNAAPTTFTVAASTCGAATCAAP